MHAEGVPATNADIHSKREKNHNNNYSLLKFVAMGSREHQWQYKQCINMLQ